MSKRYDFVCDANALLEIASNSEVEALAIVQDGNMGGTYWRLFVFFKGDDKRYFETFRAWPAGVAALELWKDRFCAAGSDMGRLTLGERHFALLVDSKYFAVLEAVDAGSG